MLPSKKAHGRGWVYLSVKTGSVGSGGGVSGRGSSPDMLQEVMVVGVVVLGGGCFCLVQKTVERFWMRYYRCCRLRSVLDLCILEIPNVRRIGMEDLWRARYLYTLFAPRVANGDCSL
jgi:hypothetical protein